MPRRFFEIQTFPFPNDQLCNKITNNRFCKIDGKIHIEVNEIFILLKVGYNIAPKIDTPLSEMLALGLERYVDELTEISSQASKEYALEKVTPLLCT